MKIYTDVLEGNRIIPRDLVIDNVLFKDKNVCFKITIEETGGIKILKQTSSSKQDTIKILPQISNVIIVE